MGYQVGRICYETEEQATDVLFSQVPPVVNTDGTVLMPVKNGSVWSLMKLDNNQQTIVIKQINPSLNQCNQTYFYDLGIEISKVLIVIFIVIYGIRIIIKLIESLKNEGE